MTKSFSIFDEGSPATGIEGDASGGSRRVRPSSAAQPKGGKRPKSAGGSSKQSVGLQIAKSNTKNAGRAAALRAFYGDDQPLTRSTPQDMSREELIAEVKELKQKNGLLEQQASSLRAEGQRLGADGIKMQQQIERMLANNADVTALANSPGGHAASDGSTKRELEKSLLVRHLKHQITALRATAADKASELEAYKRNTKASNISELLTERE